MNFSLESPGISAVRHLVAVCLLIGCWSALPAQAQTSSTGSSLSVQQVLPSTFPQAGRASDADKIQVETIAQGLENPWALGFLPDQRLLVTERAGRLRLVEKNGKLSAPVTGVPEVFASGQGGLLDVAVDPEFQKNQIIFLAYAEPGPGSAGTAVARAQLEIKLDGAVVTGRLTGLQVIYRQVPKVGGGLHFGSRIVFAKDGTLFITQGDRYTQSQSAQDLSVTPGKIVRINKDGSIPRDNPFVARSGARPEIWSLGHRNIQGATLDLQGQLWTAEHGARGGDEINRPEAGRNYGWPLITYGVDYSGAKIGQGTSAPGLEQPIHYFEPSIAPSGMIFYSGEAFPAWKGDILVGALRMTHLARLQMRDGRVVSEQRYLADMNERIRDVRQGPDGLIYLLTDSGRGKILRIRPKAS